jgi:hypothetical protein
LHGILKVSQKMKKVFALLTIVSVMSFVACKSKPAVDHTADSIRMADSAKHAEDSIAAEAAKAAEATQMNDTANHDTANHAAEGAHEAGH